MNISRLQDLLNRSKLNKVQVSKLCKVSRTTLENILAGADAKISTIESIARVFNVPVGYFFDEQTTKTVMKTKGNNSPISAYGDISIDLTGHVSILEERIKALQQQLVDKDTLISEKDTRIEDKERTIKILMDKN